MSPALALATALEHLAAARLAADPRDRAALLDLAERLVRDVLADYTPIQPVVHREALRKSSQSFRAVGAALAEGRADAGIATPPQGTVGATSRPPRPPPER